MFMRKGWRSGPSPEQREIVQRERRSRSGPWWSRPLGVLMVVCAGVAALDPDHPMPRSVQQTIAASRVTSRGLDAISPRGEVTLAEANFRWLWEGEDVEFAVVLLDEEHRPLVRLASRGKELEPAPPLEQALVPGRTFHWYVETAGSEGVVRSVPAAFAISR